MGHASVKDETDSSERVRERQLEFRNVAALLASGIKGARRASRGLPGGRDNASHEVGSQKVTAQDGIQDGIQDGKVVAVLGESGLGVVSGHV
jgi:hypothetical protein